jgi:hypothetical protein
MSEEIKNSECAEFQAHLPELIGSGVDASADAHLETCDLCRALLADLQTIAEAARQLFPVTDPPDTLWDHIESAIKSDTNHAEPELSFSDSIAFSGGDLAVKLA